MAALQDQLRHGSFQLYERSPRMLPRAYQPARLDVDCSAKTPAKTPAKRGGRRGGTNAGEVTFQRGFVMQPVHRLLICLIGLLCSLAQAEAVQSI